MEIQNPTFEPPKNDANYAKNTFNIICGELFEQFKKDLDFKVKNLFYTSQNYEKIVATFLDMKNDAEKEDKFFAFLEKEIKVNNYSSNKIATTRIAALFNMLGECYEIDHLRKIGTTESPFNFPPEALKGKKNNDDKPTPPGYYSYYNDRW